MKQLTDYPYGQLLEIRNKLEKIIFSCKSKEEVQSIYMQRKLRQVIIVAKTINKVQRQMYNGYVPLFTL